MSLQVRLARTGLAVFVTLFAACANVPQEAVDLSRLTGDNMAVLHESHRTLIKQHFANIRQQRLVWIDDVWAPRFIQKWIAEGRLVDLATGKIVFNEARDEFVAPTRGQEQGQLLTSVHSWAQAAIEELEDKRKKLIAPVDKDELELLASVDEAFKVMFRGNAAVTAHLNSLRKVQGAQDDILEALNLKSLRTKINQGLANASAKAALGKEEMDELNADLEKTKPRIEQLKQKLRRN
jgi:hypothetical protein